MKRWTTRVWANAQRGGALYKSSLIPFLVPRRKVWLTPTAWVPCSNAANKSYRRAQDLDTMRAFSTIPQVTSGSMQ